MVLREIKFFNNLVTQKIYSFFHKSYSDMLWLVHNTSNVRSIHVNEILCQS